MSNEEILDKNQQDTQDENVEQVASEDAVVATDGSSAASEDILDAVNETEGEALSAQELMEKLDSAEKKATENWDQLLRTKAEMDNIRRRTQKDLENAHKFALEKFILNCSRLKIAWKWV